MLNQKLFSIIFCAALIAGCSNDEMKQSIETSKSISSQSTKTHSYTDCSEQLSRKGVTFVSASKFAGSSFPIYKTTTEDWRKMIGTPPYSQKNGTDGWVCTTSPIDQKRALTILSTRSNKFVGAIIPTKSERKFIDVVSKPPIGDTSAVAPCVKGCGGTWPCFAACLYDDVVEKIDDLAGHLADAWDWLTD